MASTFSEQTTVRAGSRYQEGMAHLQAGEWQEAIDRFEELQREHPENEEIAQALEGARFKADLDAGARIRAKRWVIPWRSLIFGGLMLLATVAVAWQVISVVRGRVLPDLAVARAHRQRARLLAEGQNRLEAGELDAAQSRFAAVLDQAPGNEEALQGLERIAGQRLVLDLYQQAVALQDAGAYEQSLELFAEVSRRSPGYRDVADRTEAVQRRREVEDLFAEAEAADEAGRALEAVAAYERVRQVNVSYQRELIDGRLFELHMELGREIVARERTAAEELAGVQPVEQAIQHFARALALRPNSREATLEHRLATTCWEGLSAYEDQRWGLATARLRTVFDERPDYLGGTVVDKLYHAYVRNGEQYEQADNVHLAYEQYQKALQLPVDTTLARDRADSLAPRLTPTPTPTPTSTPTPAPTPQPTAVWSGGAVQEDQNLLTNPSFEGGWYDIYTGQVPEGWRILWLDGVRFPGAADVALAPETIVGQRARTPAKERDVLFLDGSQHLKVFKGFTPMYAAVAQNVGGLDEGRRYRLVVPIYVDMYTWDGRKVAPGGESGRVRLGAAPQGAAWRDEAAINYSEWWDGTDTSGFFLQYSEFTFDFEATQADMTVYVELAGIYGLNNNGFFLDDLALYPLGSQ